MLRLFLYTLYMVLGSGPVEKLKKFDLSVLETFNPDILLLEIGTDDL